jgi:hypothetical protein
LLEVLPIQALDGNGQLVCPRISVYASFHPGPPLVSGRHHTPLCSAHGGPILLLLFCVSLHQDKITPFGYGHPEVLRLHERTGRINQVGFCC